jgi:hypothetical protein
MITRKRWLPLTVALLVAVSGCGSSLVKVTGRVTYKGEAVPSTLVTFAPDDETKRPSHGLTDDNGNFTLNYSSTQLGALKTKYTVFLKYHPSANEDMGNSAPKASKELKAVIARYGDPKKSDLHYEVTENGQFIEIDLK